MSKIIQGLKALVEKEGMAQVGLWLGYADGQAVRGWLSRGKIPDFRVKFVEQLLKEKGVSVERIIRRPKGQKKAAT